MSRAEVTNNKDMHECLQRSETHVRGFAWSLVNKKRWKEWHPRIPERSPIFSFFPGLTAANDNQVFACPKRQETLCTGTPVPINIDQMQVRLSWTKNGGIFTTATAKLLLSSLLCIVLITCMSGILLRLEVPRLVFALPCLCPSRR